MSARRRRPRAARLAALATVVATALVAPTWPGPATAQDLEQVARQRDAIQQEIAAVGAELDSLQARIAVARDELASLEQRAQDLERQAADAADALQLRARASFMRGEVSTYESLLTSDPSAALDRAHFLAALSRRDVSALESALALRTQIDQTRELLTAKSAELAGLEAQMQQRSAALQERFADVTEVYRELKTRRERQHRISRGAQQGTYACIFDGAYHFTNSWGAPRSGGRRHKGTDVMAPYGAQVFAFTDGRIQRFSSGGLGGISLYLWGDDGVQYYYAHLAGYAEGIYPGKRVEAGQLIAYNGDTGNARGGAPHVHFEVHPGGGGAVNPYHWLTPVC